MRSKLRTALATTAAAALVLGSAGLAVASEVDVAVVDVTAPVTSVELAPGETGAITIHASVTGNQAGTATFEVYQDWTLSEGGFVGSNPQEFTVAPRAGGDPATKFSTVGSVTVASGHVAGDYDLSVGVFDITNSNTTGGKLAAGDAGLYKVTVSAPVVTDSTPPSVTAVLDPAAPDGDNDWYTSDVTVSWTVVDEESDVTSTSGCDPVTVDYDTTGETFTCSATSAGGTTTESVTVKRDATEPTITWNAGSPADGATYYFGDPIPGAGCSAEDATSGVTEAGCEVTGGGTTVGTHTLTASARDNAGNPATDTRTYKVLAWTIDGFYRPVDMDKVNTVKAGSTVPLKFNVFKGEERLESGIGATFSAKRTSCEPGLAADAIEEFATTGGTTLRYDEDADQWIQNWATPKSGAGNCYLVTVTTADGSSESATFFLK